MPEGEVGLMPDTGAHDGLCGSIWARAQAGHATSAGYNVNQAVLPVPKPVSGVGAKPQEATYSVDLPCAMQDWALLSLRYELHLLVHGFRKDLDDAERTGLRMAFAYIA